MPPTSVATHILLCPNPVLDLLFARPVLQAEGKLHCGTFAVRAGGFGCNAARALKALGGSPRLLLLSGGETGRELRRRLADECIPFESLPLRGATRTAVIGPGGAGQRMLVSPSPEISGRDLERLFARAHDRSRPGTPLLVGCSAGRASEDRYLALIAELCRERSCACDLRTRKLRHLLRARPALLRLPAGDAHEAAGKRLRQAVDAGVRVALLSRGSRTMLAATAEGVFAARAPSLRALNPFGAGDCLLAVLSHSLHSGAALADALRRAVGAAAASVLTLVPGEFHPADAARLADRVAIRFSAWPKGRGR